MIHVVTERVRNRFKSNSVCRQIRGNELVQTRKLFRIANWQSMTCATWPWASCPGGVTGSFFNMQKAEAVDRDRIEQGPQVNLLDGCGQKIQPRRERMARVAWHGFWACEGPWAVPFEWSQSPKGESALRNSAFGVLRTRPPPQRFKVAASIGKCSPQGASRIAGM